MYGKCVHKMCTKLEMYDLAMYYDTSLGCAIVLFRLVEILCLPLFTDFYGAFMITNLQSLYFYANNHRQVAF